MIGLDKDLFFDSFGLTHTSENIQCSVGTLCTNMYMYTRVCSRFEFQIGNKNQSTKAGMAEAGGQGIGVRKFWQNRRRRIITYPLRFSYLAPSM